MNWNYVEHAHMDPPGKIKHPTTRVSPNSETESSAEERTEGGREEGLPASVQSLKKRASR